MLCLSLNIIDVEFVELKKLIWRSYTAIKSLSITSRIEYIDKCEFAKATLDEDSNVFVLYIIALQATKVAKIAIFPLILA